MQTADVMKQVFAAEPIPENSAEIRAVIEKKNIDLAFLHLELTRAIRRETQAADSADIA